MPFLATKSKTTITHALLRIAALTCLFITLCLCFTIYGQAQGYGDDGLLYTPVFAMVAIGLSSPGHIWDLVSLLRKTPTKPRGKTLGWIIAFDVSSFGMTMWALALAFIEASYNSRVWVQLAIGCLLAPAGTLQIVAMSFVCREEDTRRKMAAKEAFRRAVIEVLQEEGLREEDFEKGMAGQV